MLFVERVLPRGCLSGKKHPWLPGWTRAGSAARVCRGAAVNASCRGGQAPSTPRQDLPLPDMLLRTSLQRQAGWLAQESKIAERTINPRPARNLPRDPEVELERAARQILPGSGSWTVSCCLAASIESHSHCVRAALPAELGWSGDSGRAGHSRCRFSSTTRLGSFRTASCSCRSTARIAIIVLTHV